MNRGVEIGSEIADDIDRSLIRAQGRDGGRGPHGLPRDPDPRYRQRPAAAVSRLLIRGARLLDPASGLDTTGDLLVEGERIAAIGGDLSAASRDTETVMADGLCLAPGLVDMRVHLREPGAEHLESIESGGRAAAEVVLVVKVLFACTGFDRSSNRWHRSYMKPCLSAGDDQLPVAAEPAIGLRDDPAPCQHAITRGPVRSPDEEARLTSKLDKGLLQLAASAEAVGKPWHRQGKRS